MPWPVARALGRGCGSLMFRLLGRYRRVALKNIDLIYGAETTRSERRRMASDVFRHFGQVAFEFVKTPQLSRADLDRITRVEGVENLDEALRPGKGVLLITGHFGNWELMARWLTTHGYKLNVVARRANDPEAEKLLTGTRSENGAQVFSRGNSARSILQALKRNEIVALLPDQNAADVFVPFFGKPTGTVDGPAVIHLRTGAALLFSWSIRMPDNRYAITFEPPVVVPASGDQTADVLGVMALVNARLEAQVRQHPTQWLWLHDRWKASPGVFPGAMEEARRMRLPYNKIKREAGERHDGANR
jgi:KDO2-lipid IV(A) lauroyltransferase